jgi:pSer/pThr/pTyr-binding forkhead associated (FHA) protein
MICVFDVISGPARGRRFWLRPNQRVEVGRISSADFSVPGDPHMSRRHLIFEGTVSSFRIRDVGSSNGTFVNDAQISSVELCNGDQIRAGETTFEVSLMDDKQNPHAKDGFTFSSSLSLAVDSDDGDETDMESTRRCQFPESLRAELRSLVSDAESSQTIIEKPSWWSAFGFQQTETACLFDELESRGDNRSRLLPLTKRLEGEFALVAVIDITRLGRFGQQQIGAMVELGVVTWHSPQVCSIVNNRSQGFVRALESTIGQDALILIGTRSSITRDWLSQFALSVSRPSHLGKLLREPTSNLVRNVLEAVDLVIFERERTGRLSLLIRDLVGSPR